LLVFECVACASRITKRHFKDKVTVTCTPHLTCACD
jgi:3-deoxy-D-arabino-heptulosonate 7-phosphate (DAHP) synthase class II